MRACPTVHPNREDKNLACFRVHDDARIAATVYLLWHPAKRAYVHDDLLRAPGLSPVGAAQEPDIDVLLQILASPPPHVIDRQQRSPGRCRQCRDTIGMHPVIPMSPQRNPDTLTHIGGFIPWHQSPRRSLDR